VVFDHSFTCYTTFVAYLNLAAIITVGTTTYWMHASTPYVVILQSWYVKLVITYR